MDTLRTEVSVLGRERVSLPPGFLMYCFAFVSIVRPPDEGELGYSLKPVLDAMGSWGQEYKAKQA